ncbi:hypothetical protein MMC27_006453 [Xylographa pallens]|nr:hypothetical protein [Xylographa pallens]
MSGAYKAVQFPQVLTHHPHPDFHSQHKYLKSSLSIQLPAYRLPQQSFNMLFSTIAVLLTTTVASLALAQPDGASRYLRKRGSMGNFNLEPRMNAEQIAAMRSGRPPPRAPPARANTLPQQQAQGQPARALADSETGTHTHQDNSQHQQNTGHAHTDSVSHPRRKRAPEPEFDFDLYARDFGLDVTDLYARALGGNVELDERDLDEALELYERGFGADFELDE